MINRRILKKRFDVKFAQALLRKLYAHLERRFPAIDVDNLVNNLKVVIVIDRKLFAPIVIRQIPSVLGMPTLTSCIFNLPLLLYHTQISSRQARKPTVALNVRHLPIPQISLAPSSLLTPSSSAAATFPDNSGLGDSRQCLKDSTPGSVCVDLTVTGNHLDIPRTGDNPNLLSPEIINQRRNSRRPSILPVPDMFTSSTLNISQVKTRRYFCYTGCFRIRWTISGR